MLRKCLGYLGIAINHSGYQIAKLSTFIEPSMDKSVRNLRLLQFIQTMKWISFSYWMWFVYMDFLMPIHDDFINIHEIFTYLQCRYFCLLFQLGIIFCLYYENCCWNSDFSFRNCLQRFWIIESRNLSDILYAFAVKLFPYSHQPPPPTYSFAIYSE